MMGAAGGACKVLINTSVSTDILSIGLNPLNATGALWRPIIVYLQIISTERAKLSLDILVLRES